MSPILEIDRFFNSSPCRWQSLPQNSSRLLRQTCPATARPCQVCLPLMLPGAKAKDIDAVGREIMTNNLHGLSMSASLGEGPISTARSRVDSSGGHRTEHEVLNQFSPPVR